MAPPPPTFLSRETVTLSPWRPCALKAVSSEGEARLTYFHFKWPKTSGPRLVKPGALSGSRARWRTTRARQTCHTAQRSEGAHSRLGLPQTRAGSRVPRQQVHPSVSPGAAAGAGCPAPAGGSRGPPIPSEIPSRSLNSDPPPSPQDATSQSRRGWTQRGGLWLLSSGSV